MQKDQGYVRVVSVNSYRSFQQNERDGERDGERDNERDGDRNNERDGPTQYVSALFAINCGLTFSTETNHEGTAL